GQSERYQIIGWVNDRLLYAFQNPGVKSDSKDRYKLMSYDYQTGQSTELAASNYFNDMLIAGDYLFYAPATVAEDKPEQKLGLYQVKVDGNDKKVLTEDETWSIFR